MLNLIITALLIISAASAAGSIIILTQFRKQHKSEIFSDLLYMQVFYFMFGFYALWGQVIIASFITPFIAEPFRTKILEISVLLGTPFIVFGWLMLIRFILKANQRKLNSYFTAIFLSLNFLFLLGLGFWKAREASLNILEFLKYYYIISSVAYTVYASWVLFRTGNQDKFLFSRKRDFGTGLMIFSLIQSAALCFYGYEIWMALIFIFLFFAGTVYLPVFIKYNLSVSVQPVQEKSMPVSFESFCLKYEISPREKEIIRQICNGLSNQQIADKLFISLQTVKDHTHRIYGKTMATSRMQLMKMVQEIDGK